MAVQTHTFYGPVVSFTATVATLTGTTYVARKVIGPPVNGNAGMQAEFILQSAGIYRWLGDYPIRIGASAISAYAYSPLADEKQTGV